MGTLIAANPVEAHPNIEDRAAYVDRLLWKCVESICVEVFSINSDAFMSKVREEMATGAD